MATTFFFFLLLAIANMALFDLCYLLVHSIVENSHIQIPTIGTLNWYLNVKMKWTYESTHHTLVHNLFNFCAEKWSVHKTDTFLHLTKHFRVKPKLLRSVLLFYSHNKSFSNKP